MKKTMDQTSKVSKTNLYITSGHVLKSLDRETHVLLMIFKYGCFAGFEAQDSPAQILDLMKRYKYFFHDEISAGLPPIRGIEHQINQVPGRRRRWLL